MCGGGERVPAEGSGAPGGVKRRAVEALTELKWAGKPGADCPWHAQDLPSHFSWGLGDEKSKGEKRVSFPCYLNPHWRKKWWVRAAGRLGPARARRCRMTPPLTSAPSAHRARSEAQACEPEELSARMRAVARASRPFPESVRFPPPPTFLCRHLRASPAPSPVFSGEVARLAYPLTNPFTSASPRLPWAPVQTPQRALGFHIPASALYFPSQPWSTSCELPRSRSSPRAAYSLPRLGGCLHVGRATACDPVILPPSCDRLLHFTDGEVKAESSDRLDSSSSSPNRTITDTGKINPQFPRVSSNLGKTAPQSLPWDPQSVSNSHRNNLPQINSVVFTTSDKGPIRDPRLKRW